MTKREGAKVGTLVLKEGLSKGKTVRTTLSFEKGWGRKWY